MNSRLKILQRIGIALIRIYQIFIAMPLQYFLGSPNCCRFTPTCSHYTLESIRRHGFFKGSLLGLLRIGRCHPWGGSGEDLVPEIFLNKSKWIRSSTKH